MIVGQHLGQIVRAQRCDRDRAGIVGVVLLRTPGAQRAHPRGAHRRHIDHRFAGRDQLLGEQVAETLGGLDRPDAVVAEAVSPLTEQDGLGRTGTDADLVDDGLELVDRNRGVGRLVRVDPDRDGGHGQVPFSRRGGTEVGTPDSSRTVRASFEPHHGNGHRPADSSLESQPAGGRHIESQPTGTIDATTTAATHPRLNQARL